MHRNHSFGGWILVIIGAIFLLKNMEIRFFHLVWPSLIILLGLWLVYRAFRRREQWDGTIHTEFAIGDKHQPNFTGEIDGVSVSHFIGETDLNLTSATLKPGINKLNVSTFIGDIRLLVPADWAVEASGSVFLGSIRLVDRSQSGIFPTCQYKSADYDAAEKKLQLNCSLFLGDIKVHKA